MSYFGDGSLKEDILSEVRYQKESHDASNIEVIAALAAIIEHFAEESND